MTPRLRESPCLMPVAKELHQLWWHLLSMAPRFYQLWLFPLWCHGIFRVPPAPPQGNKALLVQKSCFPPSSPFRKAKSPWGPGMALGEGYPSSPIFMNRISGQLPLSRTRVRVVVIEGASGPYPSCWVVGLGWILQTLLGVGAPLAHPW